MDEQFKVIHEQLIEIRRDIISLRESAVGITTLTDRVADHEIRLRELEASWNKTRGALAIASIGGGVVSGVIIALVQALL